MSRLDQVAERLRAGSCVAIAAEQPFVSALERELSALGRETIWIDLEGAESGAELGARIVEACADRLDVEELADLLERLPSRGRLDLEVLAELLLLPEQVAEQTNRRVVVILDGFQALERVVGFEGLSALREALLLRDRAAFLFVGSARVEALFTRPSSPLRGLAEVVEGEAPTRSAREEPAVAAVAADPLAAALLSWAQPREPEPEPRLSAREAWERLVERELAERRWDDDDGDDELRWRRRRNRRRR